VSVVKYIYYTPSQTCFMYKRPPQQLILFFFLWLTCARSFSQGYTYDFNGNLFNDANKGIESIHYNYLNLTDTITYEDGRKIIYSYTAAGTKLSQQILLADASVQGRRDYIGSFLYRDNVLREIQHDDGRVVPIFPGSNDTPWECQYHLKDHLGNVRNTITPLARTAVHTATMESNHAEQEERLFTGLNERSITFPPANTTPGGQNVIRLMNNTEDGVSMNLPVRSGDKVILGVNAYYVDSPDGNPGPDINPMLAMALGAVTGGVPMGVESQHTMLSSTGAAAGGVLMNAITKPVPIAHLNYTLMGGDDHFVDGGFVSVTQAAAASPEHLQTDTITIKKSGMLRVHLSNTSEIPVYFDDLTVEHMPTLGIQEDGYDPFGLTLPEQHDERVGEERNRYLYSGKEFQDEFGLNWSDHGARMYDAALAKWNGIDAKAEKYVSWSPYNYVMNNPLKFADPDGRDPIISVGSDEDKRTINKILELLRATKQGNEALEEIEKNPGIAVFVGYVSDPLYPYAGGTDIYHYKPGDTKMDMKDQIGSDALTNFHNVDIEQQVKEEKTIYYAFIHRDRDPSNVTRAIQLAHEVIPHIYIRGILNKENVMYQWASDEDKAAWEHYLYSGSWQEWPSSAYEDGDKVIIVPASGQRKGSLADLIDQQLKAAYEKELSKKYFDFRAPLDFRAPIFRNIYQFNKDNGPNE
jgi:RHS repeat-associated protein